MAVGAEQVYEMMEPRDAERRGYQAVPLHECVKFRKVDEEYSRPKVLLIKGDEGPFAVLIDSPEDIVQAGLGDIRPLPGLFERQGGKGPVWGAALLQGDVVPILDFAGFGPRDGSGK
jgi:hypothetical protein